MSRALFAGRGGEGRTHEGRSGGLESGYTDGNTPLRVRPREYPGLGWAGNVRQAAPGARRFSGQGGPPETSSARMRNKAVGLERAPAAKSTGGLRAGRGEGRLRAPCWWRVSWPPLWGEEVSAGLGFPASKGRGCILPMFW